MAGDRLDSMTPRPGTKPLRVPIPERKPDGTLDRLMADPRFRAQLEAVGRTEQDCPKCQALKVELRKRQNEDR